MRIRLLIDAVISDDDIPRMMEIVGDQAVTSVVITGFGPMTGRFMGAQGVVGNYGDTGSAASPDNRPSAA